MDEKLNTLLDQLWTSVLMRDGDARGAVDGTVITKEDFWNAVNDYCEANTVKLRDGVPLRKNCNKVLKNDLEIIRSLFRGGVPTEDIASATKWSKRTVNRCLKNYRKRIKW